MKLDILDIKGKKTGRSSELPKEIFGIDPNDHVIYLSVKQYMANQRQGTHKTKERGEITGSMKKLRKQKGSGSARTGSIKNPLLRGGGRVFGPKPHEYNIKLNKKVSKLARRSALSYKAKEKSIVLVEDFSFDMPKTKEYLTILDNLGVQDKKTLMVLPESDTSILLSGRNLKKTIVTTASQLNTYEVLNAQCLLISEKALGKIEETLK